MPCISCHKRTTRPLSSMEMNNSAAISLVIKTQNRPSCFSSKNPISIFSPRPDKIVFIFRHLSPISCQADSCEGERGAVHYRHVGHASLMSTHIEDGFSIVSIYLCWRQMWLSAVPRGSMHAFTMPAYLHNSIAYQASKPMCLCTIQLT